MKWMYAAMATIVAAAGVAQIAATIIPVSAWPRAIVYDGKQIINPNADLCVKAGYRLLRERPATPAGKVIVRESLVQDEQDATYCRYELTYSNAPVIPPEKLTNVLSGRVTFQFTTKGDFRNAVWLDKPTKTNVVGGL